MRWWLLTAFVGLMSAVSPAEARTGPQDWRRSDWSPSVPAATAFTDVEVDGSRFATIVARTPVDRTLSGSTQTYRGIVLRAEIKCGERRWRILGMSYYSADYALVRETPDVAWAPLVRETPLHASVSDVCDGGHTGQVGLKSEDVVAVQKWLEGL